MRRFVEGIDRGQATLFPECLEDWIDADNPVRVPPLMIFLVSRPLRFRFEWTAVVLCALAPPTCPRALNQTPWFDAD
jgi:hypothetical protein